jgi:hypothetical protein
LQPVHIAGAAAASPSQPGLPAAATAPGAATPAGDAASALQPQIDTVLVQLTLEQYAAFCAERSLYSDRVADVRARYQVRDEAQANLLDQLWRARFADDSALGERYASAYERYSKWLHERGPSGSG